MKRRGIFLGGVRLVWAIVLLAAPGKMLELTGTPSCPRSRSVCRLLGLRHLVQSLVEIAVWPRYRRAGVSVDASHALSLLGFAATKPRWRRPALIDAGIATGFCLASKTLSS